MGTTSTIMSPHSRFLFREKLWHNTRTHTQNCFELNFILCCDVTQTRRYPRNFNLKQFAVLSTDMKLLIIAVQLPPQTTTERMEIFSASHSTDLYFVLKNQAHKRGQLIKNRPWRKNYFAVHIHTESMHDDSITSRTHTDSECVKFFSFFLLPHRDWILLNVWSGSWLGPLYQLLIATIIDAQSLLIVVGGDQTMGSQWTSESFWFT